MINPPDVPVKAAECAVGSFCLAAQNKPGCYVKHLGVSQRSPNKMIAFKKRHDLKLIGEKKNTFEELIYFKTTSVSQSGATVRL